MSSKVTVVGAGLAGSECALQLARRGIHVRLIEQRPCHPSPAHHTDGFAELVCSNSLKSTKPDSAAGLLCLSTSMRGFEQTEVVTMALKRSLSTARAPPAGTAH